VAVTLLTLLFLCLVVGLNKFIVFFLTRISNINSLKLIVSCKLKFSL
jgi:hypothetical protein